MGANLTSTICVLSLFACTGGDRGATADTAMTDTAAQTAMPATASATATVRDAAGRELGTLTLIDSTGAIVVSGRLTGLTPGQHGMHLHTTGRCDPPTFESADGHWNPTNRQHGSQNPQGPHLGDLPNVTIGSDSIATVQGAMTPAGSLRSGPNMLLDTDGAALIIHAGPDDYRTAPSGNSGDPVACGVVTGM